MPTSDPTGILPVIHDVMKLRPRSILDVGVGMGKWGLLFREYLEGWAHHRYSKPQWQLRIDGIEIYQQYLQPWHHEIYNNLYVGDIRNFQFDTQYDLVYMGDVIEHMTKQEGHTVLRGLGAKWVIVSTPNCPTQMKRRKPNPYQDHKCRWGLADFNPYRHVVLRGAKNERLLVVRIDR